MKLKSVLWRFTFALLSYLSVCLGEFVVVSSLTSDTSTQKKIFKSHGCFSFLSDVNKQHEELLLCEFQLFQFTLLSSSFLQQPTYNERNGGCPEKKRRRGDSMQPIPFLSSPGLWPDTLPQNASMFLSCVDPATLSALKNVNKIKLRGVMHTLVFFF